MRVGTLIPVVEMSQVSQARRAAVTLANRLEFDETRAGQVALIVSELATNLARHARQGEILIRPLSDGSDRPPGGLEVLALDRGPGIADLSGSRRDGFSTGGTLGHGLGAIQRQADVFEMYSQPSGTVAAAQIWREPIGRRPRSRFSVPGAVCLAHPAETVCGDDWGWRAGPDRIAVLLADGLGHGLHAHEAARQAVTTFHSTFEGNAQDIVGDVHAALRPTRGAAVAALVLQVRREVGAFCGLGNISSHVLHANGARHSMVSHNGTAGHGAPRIQDFNYPIPADAVVVMHSDGLATHWDLNAYPGLLHSHPSLIAGILYRDYSRERDDVTVVVLGRR